MTVFISNMDQFNEHVASGSKATLLLGGELVYMTHDKASLERLQVDAGERYIVQPPRIASKGRFLERKKDYLYVAVAREAAEFAQGYRGQVLVAADHYLAFGLAQKRNCIVIGGGANSDQGYGNDGGTLNLEIFVFTNNHLVETLERNTASTSYMLDITLRSVIENYPDHHILWCDPLGDPPILDMTSSENFEVVGDAPVKHLIKRRLYTKAHSADESWGILPATAIGLAGVTIFVAATSYQWLSLESERAEYHSAVAGYEGAYSNSTQSLDLLRHRTHLMNEEPSAVRRVHMLEQLMNTAARIEDVIVHSVKIFSESDPEAEGNLQHETGGAMAASRDDFRLEFSVPQVAGSGARDHAEPIVAMLNHLTGMTIRVIDHGSDTVNIGEEKKLYWRYTVGGARNAL
ncbi:hypothetical protein [Stutzerimonas stutzeri]|uniref:hypothetical protein n=1 Tax=Stutzerimonas stutzeri TaxID=316 RepID=UPI0015E3F232|nr:hypothetical protein [Stutzerimonas stutzeri]MBA1280203.1 hypothetical protein [Stutzerimonas stutzeri]